MINLTPHAITLQRADGTRVTFPPSGKVALCDTTEIYTGRLVQGVPVIVRELGRVTGLPVEGTGPYLVSSMVLATVPGRRGVYAPDTGCTAVRNKDGHVEAVKRLIQA